MRLVIEQINWKLHFRSSKRYRTELQKIVSLPCLSTTLRWVKRHPILAVWFHPSLYRYYSLIFRQATFKPSNRKTSLNSLAFMFTKLDNSRLLFICIIEKLSVLWALYKRWWSTTENKTRNLNHLRNQTKSRLRKHPKFVLLCIEGRW